MVPQDYQNHPQQRSQQQNAVFNPDWIKKGADERMIEFSKEMGKFLKNKGVSSSQLRNIYGEIMRIKLKGLKNEKTAFYLLQPKIAYNAVRISSYGTQKAFKDFINKAITPALKAVDVEDEKTFDNFHKFFESILAYHKFYGGK